MNNYYPRLPRMPQQPTRFLDPQKIVYVHVGQAGVQMGHAIWEYYCTDYGVKADGRPTDEFQSIKSNSVFDAKHAQYSPRALFVDTEFSPIDEMKSGSYRMLYDPDNLITGKEGAKDVFEVGYRKYTELAETIQRQLRKYLSDHMNQGVVIVHALEGGTGSGVGVRLLEYLADWGGKNLCRIELSVINGTGNNTVGPYNVLLANHHSIDKSDINLMFDNRSVYRILSQILKTNASLTSVNRLTTQVINTMSVVDLLTIRTNLVPYPRIHFPMMTYSPLIEPSAKHVASPSTAEITGECFQKSHCMLKVDPLHGHYAACSIVYRGLMSGRPDVYATLNRLRTNERFVDWCPTGLKVSYVNKQPVFIGNNSPVAPSNMSAVMLANSTSIKSVWVNILKDYQTQFSKKIFLHHFIDAGMEEAQFKQAEDTMKSLISEYSELDRRTI